jgi:hypothetical protein
VTKSKNPPHGVLPKVTRELESPEEIEDWQTFVDEARAQDNLAAVLHLKLLNGAKNEFSNGQLEPALSPKRVAEFLAWLSYSDSAGLTATVTSGLRGLGIERQAPKPGRPKGRKTQDLYVHYIEQTMRETEQDDVFSLKRSFRKRYRGDWSERFRKRLERDKWSIQEISWLLVSNKPLSFAMREAADHFHVSFAAIERSWRRARESAKR